MKFANRLEDRLRNLDTEGLQTCWLCKKKELQFSYRPVCCRKEKEFTFCRSKTKLQNWSVWATDLFAVVKKSVNVRRSETKLQNWSLEEKELRYSYRPLCCRKEKELTICFGETNEATEPAKEK